MEVLDVRASKDFKKGHIPGAISLPQENWNTMAGLRRDSMNIIYCYAQTCHLGANAAMQFAAKGYSCLLYTSSGLAIIADAADSPGKGDGDVSAGRQDGFGCGLGVAGEVQTEPAITIMMPDED